MSQQVSAQEPSPAQRYRALFVRHKRGRQLVDWIKGLEDEIVTILRQDLDLIIIDEDFDYGEVCDKHNPDFVIFDSPGGYRSTPVAITNISARPDVPRIGFTNQDPHDTARVAFLRMMDEWRVERFFSIWGAAAMRQSPELVGRVFAAPLFFDGNLYKDYGMEKDIPVSVFGWGVAPDFYRWRTETVPELINHFPTLVYRHPGYNPVPDAYTFPVSGEAYAKMLNRSRFSLADTTRLDYLVRKHLEIPGSGAVLISPETSDVMHYGFRDLENCILGSGLALFQKIAHVADNPELYETIRRNGHELVHSKFSRDKWHYIRDWYTCTRTLKPGETVQQQGFFGPFVAVKGGAELPAMDCEPLGDSEFTSAIRSAWQNILGGQSLEEAEAVLTSMLNWVGHMVEPYMPLGVIALLRGEAAKAKDLFLKPYQIRYAREQGCTDLDPEEIAWLALTGVLLAEAEFTQQMRAAGASLRSLGLRRMEWLFQTQGRLVGPPPEGISERLPGDRLTTHWTGQMDTGTWIVLMNRVMAANR